MCDILYFDIRYVLVQLDVYLLLSAFSLCYSTKNTQNMDQCIDLDKLVEYTDSQIIAYSTENRSHQR